MLKALVLQFENNKGHDVGDLLAVARSCAKQREHSNENIKVRSILFVPEVGCHVAVYETKDPVTK
jgi:hypothetical protein